MNDYFPQYPIINRRDLVNIEEMRLVPDDKLNPFDRAELNRLREGKVEYHVLVADTPQNRESVAIKTTYFQMVAYKEGWKFNPNQYRVKFTDSNNPLLQRKGSQTRIYEFEEGSDLEDLSEKNRTGFVINGESAMRMDHGETDDLAEKVLKFPGG